MLLLLIITSCSETSKKTLVENMKDSYSIIKLRDCEYIVAPRSSSTLIHASDCNNPIHNNKNPRKYQLDISNNEGTLYDGKRVIGDFTLLNNEVDLLLYKDNLQ